MVGFFRVVVTQMLPVSKLGGFFFLGDVFCSQRKGFEVWVEVLKWDQLPICNE